MDRDGNAYHQQRIEATSYLLAVLYIEMLRVSGFDVSEFEEVAHYIGTHSGDLPIATVAHKTEDAVLRLRKSPRNPQ